MNETTEKRPACAPAISLPFGWFDAVRVRTARSVPRWEQVSAASRSAGTVAQVTGDRRRGRRRQMRRPPHPQAVRAWTRSAETARPVVRYDIYRCPRWDSNPHCMDFESIACCRLGYGDVTSLVRCRDRAKLSGPQPTHDAEGCGTRIARGTGHHSALGVEGRGRHAGGCRERRARPCSSRSPR